MYPIEHGILTNWDDMEKHTFFNEEAQNLRGVLKLEYPIEHGILTRMEYEGLRPSADTGGLYEPQFYARHTERGD